jgi:hypothetical protein
MFKMAKRYKYPRVVRSVGFLRVLLLQVLVLLWHALVISDSSSIENEEKEREQECEVDGGKGREARRIADTPHQRKGIEADVEGVACKTD